MSDDFHAWMVSCGFVQRGNCEKCDSPGWVLVQEPRPHLCAVCQVFAQEERRNAASLPLFDAAIGGSHD